MKHLLRRTGFYLVALWAAITINFIIPRLAPGDPAGALMARFQGRMTPQAIHALQLQFGISNDPLWVQYFQYLNNLLHGNMGTSFTYFPTPVSTVLIQELPWTLALVGTSVLISFTLGSLIGVLIAWRRGSFIDGVLPPMLTFFAAIPYFWLALIALYVLAYTLNWFHSTAATRPRRQSVGIQIFCSARSIMVCSRPLRLSWPRLQAGCWGCATR